jgi:hypothetical protein
MSPNTSERVMTTVLLLTSTVLIGAAVILSF